jgi:hypothetical protein
MLNLVALALIIFLIGASFLCVDMAVLKLKK